MKRTCKRLALVILVVLSVFSISFTAEAASVKAPARVTNVKAVSTVNHRKGKVVFKAKWKKVKGADGYQIKTGGEDGGGKYWNDGKINVSKTSYKANCSYGSSEVYEAYGFIKVRAYKKVKGKKVYGKWSKVAINKVKNIGSY